MFGLVLFGIGAYVTGKYFSQTHVRVEDWLNPWPLANTSGGQLVQSWYALGNGGIGGTGLGLGQAAYLVSNSNTDFIFAVIGEEMGLLGRTMVVVAFLLLAGRRPPHRPDGPFRVRQAGGHRPHHHHRVPGLLHHRRDRAASCPSPASPCRSSPTADPR